MPSQNFAMKHKLQRILNNANTVLATGFLCGGLQHGGFALRARAVFKQKTCC